MKSKFTIIVGMLFLGNHIFAQSYFNPLDYFNKYSLLQQKYRPAIPDLSTFQVVDYMAALNAFNFISKNSGIQFSYPQGGCPERAVMVHLVLDSLDIPNFRIWDFAGRRLDSSSNDRIFIYDKNKISTEGEYRITWDFHVASCILAKETSGKIDTLAFDPAMDADKPLLYIDWLHGIGNSQTSKFTFTDGKYYLFNRIGTAYPLSEVINGEFWLYTGKYTHDIEKFMALNDVAYAAYLKWLKPIMNNSNYAQKVKDIRNVLGNSSTLKEVLDRNDGDNDSANIVYLAKNYPDFLKYLWDSYGEREIKWIQRYQTLSKYN